MFLSVQDVLMSHQKDVALPMEIFIVETVVMVVHIPNIHEL
jgi:hypothetical protein